MIGERNGYVIVAVDNYVVNKCCCSAGYSSKKCYQCHEVMKEYYFKELIDACCLNTLLNLN